MQIRILTRSRTLILSFVTIVISISSAATIHATTLARMSLDQLVAAADAVARVRCAHVESLWQNGNIWTLTTFSVVQSMKGALPATVTVRLPGGRFGHLTASVDGTPKFAPGDEEIVFLEKSRAGGFSVSGWVQGTFRIARDPHSGTESVTQDSSAFPVFDAVTRTFRAEGVSRMPIEQFRARLASAIARQQEKTR